jgi:hypothetical protein
MGGQLLPAVANISTEFINLDLKLFLGIVVIFIHEQSNFLYLILIRIREIGFSFFYHLSFNFAATRFVVISKIKNGFYNLQLRFWLLIFSHEILDEVVLAVIRVIAIRHIASSPLKLPITFIFMSNSICFPFEKFRFGAV